MSFGNIREANLRRVTISSLISAALLAQGGGQPWLIYAYVLLIRPAQAQKLRA